MSEKKRRGSGMLAINLRSKINKFEHEGLAVLALPPGDRENMHFLLWCATFILFFFGILLYCCTSQESVLVYLPGDGGNMNLFIWCGTFILSLFAILYYYYASKKMERKFVGIEKKGEKKKGIEKKGEKKKGTKRKRKRKGPKNRTKNSTKIISK